MKKFIYFLVLAASILLIYNATLLDFDNLFEGESSIALIGIFASACVIVLMFILLTSRSIAQKKK